MGLITRQIGPDAKGSKLTFVEMDNNLYYLQGLGVSGLTYSANTLTLINPTGGTVSVNIASDTNTFITATTYNDLTNTITLTDNTNTSFNVYINAVSGLTVNGILSATTISGGTLYGDGSNLTGISTQDTFVTGGTYSNGTATFTNNTGGTFNVGGFVTGDTYVTGLTFNLSNYNLTIGRNDGVSFTDSLAILASDLTVTGGTYNPNTGNATFTNNTGGTFTVTGFLTGFTDTYLTGGTYSAGTLTFINNTGGTFDVNSVATGSIYTDTDNYTSGVTKTISHNLNTTNILVQIIDTNTNELIYGSIDNYQTNSVDVTLNQTLTNIKVVIVGTSYFEGSNNLPSCEIRIQGTSGLSNTNNGSDFLVPFNTTTYNSSSTTFTITNSKIQLLKPGRYMIKGRYSSFDMLDGTDFLRVAVISATTSSNGDLGTKLEYLDQGFIGTTGNGEASKAGSMVLNATGNEWIGLVALHGGASGGGGSNQGYPVFDNTFFNQPYLEIIRLGN